MRTQPDVPILIVEDSPEDYQTTVRAFQKGGLQNPIFHCSDGDDALDFLHRRRNYADASQSPRPGLILLDLNLPGTDGREVLSEVKKDEGLKSIPIVVLTTSADERDVQNCYQEGVNSYIHKPVNLEKFTRALSCMKDYWFEVVVLPGSN